MAIVVAFPVLTSNWGLFIQLSRRWGFRDADHSVVSPAKSLVCSFNSPGFIVACKSSYILIETASHLLFFWRYPPILTFSRQAPQFTSMAGSKRSSRQRATIPSRKVRENQAPPPPMRHTPLGKRKTPAPPSSSDIDESDDDDEPAPPQKQPKPVFDPLQCTYILHAVTYVDNDKVFSATRRGEDRTIHYIGVHEQSI